MPLILKEIGSKTAIIGLWEITESEDFFLKKLNLFPSEYLEFSAIHAPARRLEWLAGRWLLHQISGEKTRLLVAKTTAGKPFWPIENAQFFSLSHSDGKFAAAIISEKPCGIDFQFFTEKLRRIAPKFLNEKEKLFAQNLGFLHFVWGAKEAIFKAFGRGEVDFKRHLFVEILGENGENFVGGDAENGRDIGRDIVGGEANNGQWEAKNGQKIGQNEAHGSFRRAEIHLDYDLFFDKIKIAQTDWMLVWAIEK